MPRCRGWFGLLRFGALRFEFLENPDVERRQHPNKTGKGRKSRKGRHLPATRTQPLDRRPRGKEPSIHVHVHVHVHDKEPIHLHTTAQ